MQFLIESIWTEMGKPWDKKMSIEHTQNSLN